MTTIVLGGNGKLGRILHHYAQGSGLRWLFQSRHTGSDIQWSGDFDASESTNLFRRGATVINMIGETGGDTTTLNRMNVTFVRDLLTRCADTGVAHVILASSAAVYGPPFDQPKLETDELDPQNSYGDSKAEMEAFAIRQSKSAGCPAITIARIGNVAGADALTKVAKAQIAKREPMPLHRLPDGSAPVRSYIGPKDLFVALHGLAGTNPEPLKIFNVAHPTPVSLDALVPAYRDHLFPNLKWTDTPAPSGIPPRVVLSTEKLHQIVQFPQSSNQAQSLASNVAQLRSTGTFE